MSKFVMMSRPKKPSEPHTVSIEIGCGALPPKEIAGVYSLHNMEYIQQGHNSVD